MEPIYPLHEEHIKRFCGMPVYVVTKDGQRHVGILTDCKHGRVLLNGHTGSDTADADDFSADLASGTPGKKPKKKRPSVSAKSAKADQKAQIKGYSYPPYSPYPYYPYSPWGAAAAIDLALIAFLFLLI